jgi:hypothetical protein
MRRTSYTKEYAMILPNATGDVFASDGRLLRVDVIASGRHEV